MGKFPHPIVKNMMKIQRIVIIPEFQGFGLSFKMMETMKEIYPNFRISIVTSLKPFILALKRKNNWKCIRYGRVSSGSGLIHNKNNNNFSNNRITASFEMR